MIRHGIRAACWRPRSGMVARTPTRGTPMHGEGTCKRCKGTTARPGQTTDKTPTWPPTPSLMAWEWGAPKKHQPWWQHAPSGRQRCTKDSPNEPTCSRVLSHMRSARACQRVKGHTPTIHTPVCMCMSSIEVGGALTTRVCPLSQQVLIPLHELTVEEKKSHRSAE